MLISAIVVGIVVTLGLDVGVQIGPNGEPNFVAGSQAQMVLPVAFDLDEAAARVASADHSNAGTIERVSGLVRLTTQNRPLIAVVASGVVFALVLWILAELAALCRSVRDGEPFASRNASRVRRLALALLLAELSRAAIVYTVHAYVAAHYVGDHLRFTASPHVDPLAIVSALIVFVLAEVFRIGTRLDEDQSLTV